MKRDSYVDKSGKVIDYSYESKKALLNLFFFISSIVPLIIIGFMIYHMVENNTCNNIYDNVRKASLKYLKAHDELPFIEGEASELSVSKLYSENYLNRATTNDMACSGSVKVTKYKNEFVYTLNLTGCNVCSTNIRYGDWSKETTYFPRNKAIVDVIPYYNAYERETSYTPWSDYYDQEELKSKKSKYGVRLPIDESNMPIVPEGANIVEAQKEDRTYYRYQDKSWNWYDIVGNYSDFSSEQPAGFANKEEDISINSGWSEYSLNYPEERSYRTIESVYGYKYYYKENGKKIYANHGKYTAEDEVDTEKYTETEEETSTLYRYYDLMWRWYNGPKRNYSHSYSTRPEGYIYRDDKTISFDYFSSWDTKSSLTSSNAGYRMEETKIMTRFRYIYEILSLPIFAEPLAKQKFLDEIQMPIEEFVKLEDYKMEVSYTFRYKKSR